MSVRLANWPRLKALASVVPGIEMSTGRHQPAVFERFELELGSLFRSLFCSELIRRVNHENRNVQKKSAVVCQLNAAVYTAATYGAWAKMDDHASRGLRRGLRAAKADD